MRGLTTRGVRPRLQHSCYVGSVPPIRRTSFPPLQKNLTFGDAFLLFLPTVLTAAFVVDFTGKERKRAEWDRQIATAQEEANRLKQRQLDAWCRLQRHSVGHGAWLQRRSMFTASCSRRQDDQETIDRTEPQYLDEETDIEMDPLNKEAEINQADADAEPHKDQTTEEYQQIQQRFGRLLATRLALQLMLQLRSGRSARYKPQVTVENAGSTAFRQSLDFIVQELDKVLNLLHVIKIQDVPWDIRMTPEFYARQDAMARRIRDISEQYRDADMHLPDYLISFVQIVTEFKIGPPISSYVLMMRVLSHHQQDSPMANQVENAIFDSHDYLDSYTISNVLYQYGRNVNSVKMNEFLERITRIDNHPRPRSKWFRTHINDLDVCIPKSKNGHLMTALIRAALMNRQQTVAEAYGSVFLERDRIDKYSGVHKWFVINNFLTFYGRWNSWNAGRRWLESAVLWASEIFTDHVHALGRVILRMLDFCVACGQRDEYEMIIEAAVAASIPAPSIDPTKMIAPSSRMIQIRRDWMKRTTLAPSRHPYSGIGQDNIDVFQSMLKGRYDKNQPLSAKPFHPVDSEWRDDAPITYDPISAAKRLELATEQRRRNLNTGFKNFPSSPQQPKFPPAGPHNSLTQEPQDPDSISDLDGFASPFFQRLTDTTASLDDWTRQQPTDKPISEVDKLKQELAQANQRIQEIEQNKQKELIQLRRDLDLAQTKLQEAEDAMSSSTKLYDDNDWIRASASG